jgi:hypothetical protein
MSYESKAERQPVVVTYDDVPRLVMGALKEHFFPDWDERWKSDRYLVTYKVGDVEEAFSFRPSEIEDAAVASVQHFIVEMANSRGGVGMQSGNGESVMAMMVHDLSRDGQNLIEYLVRRKHQLPKVLDAPNKQLRHAIKTLIRSDCVPQNETQRVVWRMMVFGLMMWFRGKPIDHDHLEIMDVEPGRHPLLSLGARMIDSHRHLET